MKARNLFFSFFLFLAFKASGTLPSSVLEVIGPYENFIIDIKSLRQSSVEIAKTEKKAKAKKELLHGVFSQDIYNLLKTKMALKDCTVVLVGADNNTVLEMPLFEFIEKNFLSIDFLPHNHLEAGVVMVHLPSKKEKLWWFAVKSIIFKDYGNWFDSPGIVWKEVKDIHFKSPFPTVNLNAEPIYSLPLLEMQNPESVEKLKLIFLGGKEEEIPVVKGQRYLLLNPQFTSAYLKTGGLSLYVLTPSVETKKLKFGPAYFYLKKIIPIFEENQRSPQQISGHF